MLGRHVLVLGQAEQLPQGLLGLQRALTDHPKIVAATAHLDAEPRLEQTQVLIDGAVLVDLERRRLGVGEDLDLGDVDLDLARDQIRIDVLGFARDH